MRGNIYELIQNKLSNKGNVQFYKIVINIRKYIAP